MFELVIANLKVRPLRTLISVVGVALGVVLVMLFTGLVQGVSDDMARRAANWKAEIVFTRAGAMELMASNLNVPVQYTDRLLKIKGIESTVAVGRYVSPSNKGRWGVQQVDGVDWEPFSKMNDMELVKGSAAVAIDEVIIDERQARDDNVTVGDSIELFGGKKYKVTGIFAPPSGSRIKMSLGALQQTLDSPDKCTYILVKLKDGEDVEAVAARINQELPGNKINLTRDLIIDASDRVPGLSVFLRTLVGLGAFVSTIFVLLSMYTTVTERRKEIGILKSLGASKTFIIRVIEGEAFLIGVMGIVLGFATSFVASRVILAAFELQFIFDRDWMISAVAIALAGSLLGALYPAWKAAGIDPVEVMVNE